MRGALDKVDDRRTPRSVFDPLNAEFEFTLDAAASAENALCEEFYSLDNSGLDNPWYDHNVWVNPPYSDLRSWVEKAQREMAQQPDDPAFRVHVSGPGVVVMLLPANRTEQAWWQDIIEPRRHSGEIETRFLRGRLRFDTPSHDYTKQPKGNRPPFGVVLVIWRRNARNKVAA